MTVGVVVGAWVDTLTTASVNVVGATKAVVSTTTGNPRSPRSVRACVRVCVCWVEGGEGGGLR